MKEREVMYKIAYVVPFFGKFPKGFEFWLLSCKCNPTIDWLIFTDDQTPYDYPENVKVTYFSFEKMKEKYDIIGDVRGIGGMLGIEFVKDKERKEPNPEFVSKLVQTALQKGLLLENAGSFGNVIRFLAPLCMTEEQMETGLKIFEESILANL